MVLLQITHSNDEALGIGACPSGRSSSEVAELVALAELVLRLGWLLLLLAMDGADGRPVASLRLNPRAAFGFRLFPVVAIFPLLRVVVVASKSADVGKGIVIAIVVAAVVVLLGVVDTAKVGECRVVER